MTIIRKPIKSYELRLGEVKIFIEAIFHYFVKCRNNYERFENYFKEDQYIEPFVIVYYITRERIE